MSATGRSGLRTASTAGYLAAVNRGVATRAGRGAARPQEARIGAELKAAQERGELARADGSTHHRPKEGVRASDTFPTTLDALGIPSRRASEMLPPRQETLEERVQRLTKDCWHLERRAESCAASAKRLEALRAELAAARQLLCRCEQCDDASATSGQAGGRARADRGGGVETPDKN